MRVVFMGTPDFAVPALSALTDVGHDVVCVYSQPPRPSGRGHKYQPSAVHAFAESKSLEVRHPTSLKDEDVRAAFANLNVDVVVVAAYGLILPQEILEAPRLGCLNIHASLLPRWRGAAPIQRAILAGDIETGVTIMQMDKGLDTGDILLSQAVPIEQDTTAADLHNILADVGAELIVEALSGDIPPAIPQPEYGVTYALKLDREEGRVNWTDDAHALDRRVRALNPWPGVWCEKAGERLRILSAVPAEGKGNPGEVIGGPLVVACGNGALRLDRVQRAGKSAMSAEEYVRGNPVSLGTLLE